MARVFRQEWRLILRSPGAMLFFIALPLMYPVVYTLIYNPEVVRQVPVAVVDDCRSEASRELVRQAAAAPSFKLYGYAPNMADAKEWWAQQKVYAILHIPADYDKKINNGEQANADIFCDMSLLLRFRALYATITSLQLKLATDITAEKAMSMGMDESSIGMPVDSESHFLGDTQQGFASFVIPGIVVLILQQSMVLGAALLGGTSRERRRANGGRDPEGVDDAPAYATVWGKALAYTVLYIPASLYILHIVPTMFDLPHYGKAIDYLLFAFPLLLASAMLGQSMVVFIKEREYVFPVIVFTSVIFLFLSGLTWPRYAMQSLWYAAGSIVPSTWGVEGFIRINSNAATLAENSTPYLMLWALAIAYSICAALLLHRLRRKGC